MFSRTEPNWFICIFYSIFSLKMSVFFSLFHNRQNKEIRIRHAATRIVQRWIKRMQKFVSFYTKYLLCDLCEINNSNQTAANNNSNNGNDRRNRRQKSVVFVDIAFECFFLFFCISNMYGSERRGNNKNTQNLKRKIKETRKDKCEPILIHYKTCIYLSNCNKNNTIKRHQSRCSSSSSHYTQI